jgi:hypothetical protein
VPAQYPWRGRHVPLGNRVVGADGECLLHGWVVRERDQECGELQGGTRRRRRRRRWPLALGARCWPERWNPRRLEMETIGGKRGTAIRGTAISMTAAIMFALGPLKGASTRSSWGTQGGGALAAQTPLGGLGAPARKASSTAGSKRMTLASWMWGKVPFSHSL